MDEPIDPYGAGWYPPTPPYTPAPYTPVPYGYAQPQPGYGYPPQQPPTPPKTPDRGRRTRITVLSCIFVAAAVVLTVLVLSGSPSKPASPVVVPASIGDSHRITDATADRVKQAMESEAQSIGLAKAFLDHTSLGVYGASGSDQPNLILVVGRTDAVPGLQSNNASDAVDELLSGAVNQPTTYASGSHGGSLKCGAAALAASLETACGWYDKSTIGLLLSINPAQPPAALAVMANVVRDDVD